MKKISVLFVLVSLILTGCGFYGEEHALIDTIKKESVVSVDPKLSSDQFLKGVKKIEVKNVEGVQFFVVTREDKNEKFSCIKCHEKGKHVSLQNIKEKATFAAHWGYKLKHAKEMSCKTCHYFDDMDKLIKLNGEKIGFNHSYNLCAQCHFQQYNDWVGGGHGKRVGGWAPPRVILNCTSCHNPHKPAIEKRWPKTYFSQMRLAEK